MTLITYFYFTYMNVIKYFYKIYNLHFYNLKRMCCGTPSLSFVISLI